MEWGGVVILSLKGLDVDKTELGGLCSKIWVGDR